MTYPAVLIIAFNRPSHVITMIDALRKIKPEILYIAIDGARPGNSADVKNIAETVDAFELIDWPCEIKRHYNKENKGCKIAVSGAISWFFEHEESGIILEDDCIPSLDFFDFCKDMLLRYRDIDSIMHINGVNFQNGITRGVADYYFSNITHVWGWATWRRAWKRYDINMVGIEEFLDQNLYRSKVINQPSYEYWIKSLQNCKLGLIDTWDYQWVFSIWKNNGLTIAPNYNLVKNVGFDAMATHTKTIDEKVANKAYEPLPTSRTYTDVLVANHDADLYSFQTLFRIRGKFRRLIINKLRAIKAKLITK